MKNPDEPAQTKRTAEILVGQAERITRIVSHMLDMTRRPSAVRREIDPASVVRRVVDLVEYEARRRQLKVTLDVQERGRIHADPDQLEQIVLNLCRNAFEAAPQGTEVRLVSSCGPGGFRLDVTDHGEGIPAEAASHVFEPFFTTKGHAGGSGLGLSVVKSLVEQHDGLVNYVSFPGKGTTLSVVLPNEDLVPTADGPSFAPVRPRRRHYPVD